MISVLTDIVAQIFEMLNSEIGNVSLRIMHIKLLSM